MTTKRFYRELTAFVILMTDQCFLNCDVSRIIGVEPLVIKSQTIDSICTNIEGKLFFYDSNDNEILPEEEDCEVAMNWIEENYADLFDED